LDSGAIARFGTVMAWAAAIILVSWSGACVSRRGTPGPETLIEVGDSVRVTLSEPGYAQIKTGLVFSLAYGVNRCVALSLPSDSAPPNQYAADFVVARETQHIQVERWRASRRRAASWIPVPFANPEAGLPRCIVGTWRR